MKTSIVTAYIDDPRVEQEGDGFIVTIHQGGHSHRFSVLWSESLGWGIYTGPDLQIAIGPDDRFLIGFVTADDALYAILGEPQR